MLLQEFLCYALSMMFSCNAKPATFNGGNICHTLKHLLTENSYVN